MFLYFSLFFFIFSIFWYQTYMKIESLKIYIIITGYKETHDYVISGAEGAITLMDELRWAWAT